MVLLKILRKMKYKEKEIRILMLGLDNAGKTTIVKKFIGEDISLVHPTFGFNINSLEYKEYKLNVWDIGGQQSLRTYWRNYFEQTDALIWVVDSADVDRMQDCAKELESLLLEEKLAGASLLILANKQDLSGSLSVAQISKELRLENIKTRDWHIEPCSVITGQGLVEGIDWLVEDVASRLFLLE